MQPIKDLGGRPQKSLTKDKVQGVTTLGGVLAKQQLAACFAMCGTNSGERSTQQNPFA